MATTTEVPIVWVEQTGPIVKSPVPWSKTPGFAAPIRYRLADGTTVDAAEIRSRKKDVAAALALLPGRPKRPSWAVFHDGEYVGAKKAHWIGAGADSTGATAEWLAACESYEEGRSDG